MKRSHSILQFHSYCHNALPYILINGPAARWRDTTVVFSGSGADNHRTSHPTTAHVRRASPITVPHGGVKVNRVLSPTFKWRVMTELVRSRPTSPSRKSSPLLECHTTSTLHINEIYTEQLKCNVSFCQDEGCEDYQCTFYQVYIWKTDLISHRVPPSCQVLLPITQYMLSGIVYIIT